MICSDETGRLSKVLHPYLIANDLIGKKPPKPQRYVIDFQGLSLLEAQEYPTLFANVKGKVLPTREAGAQKEADRKKAALEKNPGAKIKNKHHAKFLKK
jgi:hypothetical protein